MKKAKILIVDDRKVDSRVMRDALEIQGYQVETNENAFEALEKIPKFQPDLITLDYRLPKMNGLQFLERLKSNEATANIPVIFVSIYSSKPEIQRAAEKYGFQTISKPLDIDEFREAVKATLAKAASKG